MVRTQTIGKWGHTKNHKNRFHTRIRAFTVSKTTQVLLGSKNYHSKFIPNAATLTDKLRTLSREENEKKKMKNIKVPVKKFEWSPEHSVVFEGIKKVKSSSEHS